MRLTSNTIVRLSLIAGVSVLLVAVLTTPLLAQENTEPPVAFSPDEPVTIESVPDAVGEGEISFERGDEPDHIVLAIDGTVLQYDDPAAQKQYACLACIETIHLAPDMRIPLEPFFVDEVMADLDPQIIESGKVTTSISFEDDYVKLIFEGVVLGFLAPVEDGDKVIASGPDGATLTKEGNGFLLVDGAAEYVIAGEGTTPTSEPSVLIELREADDPGTPLQLDVVHGDYSLVNGLTLRAGSSLSVHEDWMTFPAGLAIDVGPGGISLLGEDYPEGKRLVVDEAGNLVAGQDTDETEVELATYSDVVATYPSDADLCNTDATIIGGSDGGWKVKGTVSIRNGKFTYHCYGAKITLEIDTTWDDGTDYPAGTLLTVDADLNWVPVASWD